MPDSISTSSTFRTAGGRFAPGNPGGPGRPRGAVSAAAVALDAAAAAAQQEILHVVLDKARAGDLRAIEMMWARVWPLRRSRPVALPMPPITTTADAVLTKVAVAGSVLEGDLSAEEARPLLELLDKTQYTVGLEEVYAMQCARRAAKAKAEPAVDEEDQGAGE